MIDPDHLIAQRARAIDASGIRKCTDLIVLQLAIDGDEVTTLSHAR